MNGTSTTSSSSVSATSSSESSGAITAKQPPSNTRGPSNGYKRTFKPKPTGWVQKASSEIKQIPNVPAQEPGQTPNTPKQETVQPVANAVNEIPQDKEKESKIRIRVTNIHSLVTDNEFLQTFKKELDPIPMYVLKFDRCLIS